MSSTREKIDIVKKQIRYYAGDIEHLDRLLFIVEETLQNYPETRTIVVRQIEIPKRNRFTRAAVKEIASCCNEWVDGDESKRPPLFVRSRKAEVIRLRTSFCKFAYEKGFGVAEIGRFLELHHATIISHLRKGELISDTRVIHNQKAVI